MDGPPKRKHKRAANWTSEEKNIALKMIQPVIHIVDNKAVNIEVNQAKARKYQEISEKFYQLTGIKREAKDIKGFWKRWKDSKKKINVVKEKCSQKTSLQRKVSWKWKEKKMFIKILGPSLPILENKINKTDFNVAKVKEWQRLSEELHKLSGTKRDPKELKSCWKRLKGLCKKQHQLSEVTTVYDKIVAEYFPRSFNFDSDDEVSIHSEDEPFLGFPINKSIAGNNSEVDTENQNRMEITDQQWSSNDRVSKQFTLSDLIEDLYRRPEMDEKRDFSRKKRSNMDEDKEPSNDNYKTKRPNITRSKHISNNKSKTTEPYMDDENSEEIDVINDSTRPNMDETDSRDENSLVNMGHNWTMNRPDIDRLREYIEDNLKVQRPNMDEQSEVSRSWDIDRYKSLEDFTCEDNVDSHQADIPELSDHTYCQMPHPIKKEIEDPPDKTAEGVNCLKDPLQLDVPIKEEIEENKISNELNNETPNKVDEELNEMTKETSNEETNETSEEYNSKNSSEAKNKKSNEDESLTPKPTCVTPLRGKQSPTPEADTILKKDYPLFINADSLSMNKNTHEIKKEGLKMRKEIRDVPKNKSRSIDSKNERRNKSQNAETTEIKQLEELRRVRKQIEEAHTVELNYQRKKLEYLQSKHKIEMEMMVLAKRRKEMELEMINMINKLM